MTSLGCGPTVAKDSRRIRRAYRSAPAGSNGRLALLLLTGALTICPAALATITGYAGDGFYAAGADPCEQHGSTVVGAPTTGYDPLTGEWFDEYSCADNTKVRVPRAAPPPREEEAGYDPDPPPPAACTEAHYSDDPDNPWDEGTC